MRTYPALLTVILGGLLWTAPADASEMRLERGARGHPLVEVAVNGEGPFTMLLDTGAGLTTVTTGLKDELGLILLGRSPQPMQLAGGAEPVDLYTLGFVTIGGRPAPAPITVILDAPMKYLKPARGILGINVLGRFAIDIDQPNRRLILNDAGTPPPGGVDWETAVFNPRYDDFVVIDVSLGGVEAKAVVDTGANGTVVNDVLAAKLGIVEGAPGVKAGEILVGGGKTLKATAGPLTLGRGHWPMLEVQASELPLFKALEIGDGPALILGNDALAQVRLYIDYQNDRLYFTLPPHAPMVGQGP